MTTKPQPVNGQSPPSTCPIAKPSSVLINELLLRSTRHIHNVDHIATVSYAALTMRKKLLIIGFLFPLMSSIAMGKEIIHFTDIPDNAWYSSYVQQAVDQGILTGQKDSQGNLTDRFGPSNAVTFGEALKMTVLTAGYDPLAYPPLYDRIPCTHWACFYYRVVQSGDWSETVCSNDGFDFPMTRQRMAGLVANAFGLLKSSIPTTRVPTDSAFAKVYKDLDGTLYNPPGVISPGERLDPEWNYIVLNQRNYAILRLTRDHILSGDIDDNGEPTGTFRPHDSLNRAEAVKIVMEAEKKYGRYGEGRSNPNRGGIEGCSG